MQSVKGTLYMIIWNASSTYSNYLRKVYQFFQKSHSFSLSFYEFLVKLCWDIKLYHFLSKIKYTIKVISNTIFKNEYSICSFSVYSVDWRSDNQHVISKNKHLWKVQWDSHSLVYCVIFSILITHKKLSMASLLFQSQACQLLQSKWQNY